MIAAGPLNALCAGAGPGLVLLHPIGLDHTYWGGLIDAVAGQHRVLAVDLRGHGGSPAARSGATMDDYAADVAEAMRGNGIAPAVVLGLSFGGMVAQRLALNEPDIVSGLVLCGCSGGFSPDLRPILRERGLAARHGGMVTVVEATIERWFNPSFRPDPVVERVRRHLLDSDPADWSAGWHAIAEFDALSQLGDLRMRSLVIAGSNDAATPMTASRTLAEALGTDLEVLPGAPHMMQLETPERFAAAVTTFMKTPQPQRRPPTTEAIDTLRRRPFQTSS